MSATLNEILEEQHEQLAGRDRLVEGRQRLLVGGPPHDRRVEQGILEALDRIQVWVGAVAVPQCRPQAIHGIAHQEDEAGFRVDREDELEARAPGARTRA